MKRTRVIFLLLSSLLLCSCKRQGSTSEGAAASLPLNKFVYVMEKQICGRLLSGMEMKKKSFQISRTRLNYSNGEHVIAER